MKDYIEERAVEIANYIIENNATVRQTAKKFGISKSTVHKDVTERLEELDTLPKGRMIIRSHGVSRQIEETMREKGFEILDATCPFVKKIHRIVSEYSKDGYHIVIIGNANHPEVEGIREGYDHH